MRAISFVHSIKFDFPGNLCKEALAIGDVDNDKKNELVVGNISGTVSIFRGESSKPSLTINNQGMVAAIVIGDILNQEQNFLIVISVEGWCHLFDIKKDTTQEPTPFHTQRLPANTKSALLADVDGDGKKELVLGLTDRVIRTYRWANLGQVPSTENRAGKLVGLHKWEFAHQIGSIALETSGTVPALLVAQPGGTYSKLECLPPEEPLEEIKLLDDSSSISKLIPELHPLASSRMRNNKVSTEIIGQVKGTRDGQEADLLALATLDGTLMLVDGDQIIWSIQVDHQLFSLAKLDLTGDGREEVIACSWDGQTYMVNQERMSLRFQFEEPVCAFKAGYFTLDNGETSPCLVYSTFQDQIHLYYDVRLQNVKIQSFLDVVETDQELREAFQRLNVDPAQPDEVKKYLQKTFYEE